MTDKNQGVRWDLTSFFKAFNGPEMAEYKERLTKDIAELQEKAAGLEPLSDATADAWEEVVLAAEDYYARSWHLSTYIGCLESADAANEEYAKERAKLSELDAEYDKFDVDLLRAFKSAGDACFDSFASRKKLKPIAYRLRRIRERAQKTMSTPEEKLSADLGVDGFHSWGRLYDKVSSKLEFDMRWPDGKKERLPISRWRALMSDPDPKVGRAAFEGGNRAWRGVEDVCAAALNAIAGTRLTLYRHRGVPHFLDQALFQAGCGHKTLEALYRAIHDNISIGRDIFKAKAAYSDRKGIHWFEREAPLPLKGSSGFSWESGVDMVSRAFKTVYPGLAGYFGTFLDNGWMESESRGGKRPGAFCTGSPVNKEQRVYMTYNGALGDITTMAHEVGHAWHGHLMKEMRPWAKGYPMPLAETASIFAEQILSEGVYADESVGDKEKLLMLDADLCGAAVLLLDITVRFEFEKTFHEERAKGEVAVSRLKELMAQTQRRVWSDCMLPGGEDPLFWASKLHFYITDISFYNFPYTMGFLLAKALFNMFRKDGDAFLPKYERFLKLTGSDTLEGVARECLDADTEDPAFWAESIRSLDKPLERYRELLSKPAAV